MASLPHKTHDDSASQNIIDVNGLDEEDVEANDGMYFGMEKKTGGDAPLS